MGDAIGPGEAARRLGVSTRTVQRWLREGRLPGVRVGRRLKVDPAALPAAAVERGPTIPPRRPISRLLVANRGELVVRIARTCRRLGITCLALAPEDQADAWWTSAADEVVGLDGGYLDSRPVLAAASDARANAIHPGYGFLAENPDFAEAVVAAGLAWVGPPASAMRQLGDKATARRLAASLGVPVLPGYDGDDQSDEALLREAGRAGFPVLVKPSAGGGGKGMHVARNAAQLRDALGRARREARASFGDDRLIIERNVERPRHIEIQLLCDAHGNAVHLGERECSLQRRHQKVVEEAPSTAVTPELRARLGEAALTLARAAGYEGAGTAEFLLAEDGRFYFLELNARLQVEHPVTELITGRDLVADQLRIAGGAPLGFGQSNVSFGGHAIEARLYAEDAATDFLPATGKVADARWPAGAGLRVDAGVGIGDVVGTRYDPLLAKIVAHGDDRPAAVGRLDAALAATSVLGVTTNRGFLRWLIALPEVRRGEMHTQLIDERWAPPEPITSPATWRRAAEILAGQAESSVTAVPTGFRLNAPSSVRVRLDGEERSVSIADPQPGDDAGDDMHWAPAGEGVIVIDIGGRAVRASLAAPPNVETAVRHAHPEAAGERIIAPMPGSVLQLHVAEGDIVDRGQVLLVLEAMKMENNVVAPSPGTVQRVHVAAGQQVQRGDVLVEVA